MTSSDLGEYTKIHSIPAEIEPTYRVAPNKRPEYHKITLLIQRQVTGQYYCDNKDKSHNLYCGCRENEILRVQ